MTNPVAAVIGSSVRIAYNHLVRPHLPRKIATYSGIAVRKPRLLDATDTCQDHPKRRLIQVTRDAVRRGDRVVVIGAGEGLSPTAAAVATGPKGCVDIYEASAEFAARATETLELNAVHGHATIHHAIVGEALDVMGEMGDPDVIDPTALPECDMLEMDCEGAEVAILKGLDKYPDRMVIETHPRFGAPTALVSDLLSDAGYEIKESLPDPVAGDILHVVRR